MTCDGNLGSKGLFPLVLSIVDSLHGGAVNRSLKKYMSHCQKAMNCPTIWFPLKFRDGETSDLTNHSVQ